MEEGCCHAVNPIINNVKLSASESCCAIVTVVFILGRHFRQLEDVVWRRKDKSLLRKWWKKASRYFTFIWPPSVWMLWPNWWPARPKNKKRKKEKKPWDQASCLNQAEVSEDFQPLTLTFCSFYRFFLLLWDFAFKFITPACFIHHFLGGQPILLGSLVIFTGKWILIRSNVPTSHAYTDRMMDRENVNPLYMIRISCICMKYSWLCFNQCHRNGWHTHHVYHTV